MLTQSTHAGEVLVPRPDPEGPVGASVPEDHALGDRVAVDKPFVPLLLKARRVPALLHHLDGHLRHGELVPVGHLGRLRAQEGIERCVGWTKTFRWSFSVQNYCGHKTPIKETGFTRTVRVIGPTISAALVMVMFPVSSSIWKMFPSFPVD